jgi:DNA (cytosine-5)-methyltransferase 1
MGLLAEQAHRAGVLPGTPEYDGLRKQVVPPYSVEKFADKWRKLDPDSPAHTLTAHLGKDTYSHIHYDRGQARTITVREAARLQSFPDGFTFIGGLNAAFRQIGNSVPPLLAQALASMMRAALQRAASGLTPDLAAAPGRTALVDSEAGTTSFSEVGARPDAHG